MVCALVRRETRPFRMDLFCAPPQAQGWVDGVSRRTPYYARHSCRRELSRNRPVLNLCSLCRILRLWIESGKNRQSMKSWRAANSSPKRTSVNQRQRIFGNWRQSCWLSFAGWRSNKATSLVDFYSMRLSPRLSATSLTAGPILPSAFRPFRDMRVARPVLPGFDPAYVRV